MANDKDGKDNRNAKRHVAVSLDLGTAKSLSGTAAAGSQASATLSVLKSLSSSISCSSSEERAKFGPEFAREWEAKYGEPCPQNIKDWTRLAARAGVSGETLLNMLPGDIDRVIPIAQGYLQRLQDQKLLASLVVPESTALAKPYSQPPAATPTEAEPDTPPADDDEPQAERTAPQWNRDTGELSLGGEVIKRIKNLGQATNITAVLDAFQEEGWLVRIDDPLPGGRNPERLKDTIRSLNENLSRIKFVGDGSGQGIRWEAI